MFTGSLELDNMSVKVGVIIGLAIETHATNNKNLKHMTKNAVE